MPAEPLVDLSVMDVSRVLIQRDEIRRVNPQRDEMEQLDGIVHIDRSAGVIVGVRDVRDDEWWTGGHLPGRPILPGVLMCEAAAQLCSYYIHLYGDLADGAFVGFAGMDHVRFRRPVVPGDRLTLVARCKDLRPRAALFATQGFVAGAMVFEGDILGMTV